MPQCSDFKLRNYTTKLLNEFGYQSKQGLRCPEPVTLSGEIGSGQNALETGFTDNEIKKLITLEAQKASPEENWRKQTWRICSS